MKINLFIGQHVLPVHDFSLLLGLHPHYVPQLVLQVLPIKKFDPGKLKQDPGQACSMEPGIEISHVYFLSMQKTSTQ